MVILLFKIYLLFLINSVLTEKISVDLPTHDGNQLISIEDFNNNNNYNGALSTLNQEAICNETQSCKNGGSCLKYACLCLPGTSGPLCEIVNDCQRETVCKKDDRTYCEYSVELQRAYCHCGVMEYRFDDATKTCRSCLCTPTFSQVLSSFSYCEYRQGQQVCTCTEGYAYNPSREICGRCNCGPNSTWCEYNKEGNIVCGCKEGYAPFFESCRECDCGKHGKCNLFGHRYQECECDPGYEEYKLKCVECKCGKYGKCAFDENGKQTSCECLPGYAEKVGKCEMCNCGQNSNCSYEGDTKVCNCEDGFENINGFCADINECEKHNPCQVSTKCANTLGSYKCICDKGYKRNHETMLCDDIDECELSITCAQPNTKCVNTPGSYKCICESNFVTRGGSDSDTFCEKSTSNLIYTLSLSVFLVVSITTSAIFYHQIIYLRRRNASA